MCGRFALKTPPKILGLILQAEISNNLETFEPRFNIAPSSSVPVILFQNSKKVMESLKWGLIPSWAKDPSIGFKLANARAETVTEKPSFRSAFKKQRCLVPVDGFYEWNQSTKPKQPYYFFMKDEKPFFIAGLWEYWKAHQSPTQSHKDTKNNIKLDKEEKKEPEQGITTFTLITTEANAVLAKVHDRMPVILDPKDYEAWLDPNNQDLGELQKFLKPYDASKMDSYPVSTFVSNARNQGEKCMERL
jgi:putative SOS response-associated peptidase YedK